MNGRPVKLLSMVLRHVQWPQELQVQNLSHKEVAAIGRREHLTQVNCEPHERAVYPKFAEQQMQEEQAQGDENHLTANTSYNRVTSGVVLASPSTTTAMMAMSDKVSPECLGVGDPVDLPLVTVPPPLYSEVPPTPESSSPSLPPPTPLLRQNLSQSEEAVGLPVTMEPPSLHLPPPVDLDSTQHPVRTPTLSTACFLGQFQAIPCTDTIQVEVLRQSSSDRHFGFPERFQSGRAATRRHRPSHYRVGSSPRLQSVSTPAILATEKETRAR